MNRQGKLLTSIGAPGTDSIGAPELSSDEKAIALFLNPRGNNEIGIIDLVRNMPRLITNGPPADAHPTWDPDGRHLVYISGRLNGTGPVRQAIDGTGEPHNLFPNDTPAAQVYLQAFPKNAGRIQVSTIGGAQVRWSADGRELFYIAPDGKMMAVTLLLAASPPVVHAPVALFQTYLASGGNIVGNKPQYAVSRDGRFLLNAAIETPSKPIVVSINWQSGLQR